jgi:hypothetical protein
MKTKMKSFVVFMALVMLISSFTVLTVSAANISYSVTSVEGKKGDTVTVSVKLSSDIDIWGANVMLGYNSSELEVVKCTKGDVASSGSLHDTGSSVNYSGMYSSKKGTVYTVEFKILKSSGTSKLTLTSTENIDGSGKFYSCSVSDGKVTVLGSPAVSGDANNDGNMTAVDARVILQHVAGVKTLTASQSTLVDMNGDGNITAIDARIILQKVAGLK